MRRFLFPLIALVLVIASAGAFAVAQNGGGVLADLGPFSGSTPAPDTAAEPTPTTPNTTSPSTLPAVPATTAPATPAATPTPTEAVGEDAEVARVQERLAELRYYVGPIDGAAGPATASAVQAFQKVQGLSADGVIGPNTVAALDDPEVPTLRGGPADRVEVDLDTQVMYLVDGGQLARILPISSGSGGSYAQPSGGTAQSLTPVGTFTVERHIRGVRNAPLGTLYDPLYFYGGWAIHGSNSVPAYPASHGCVRVTRADAQWLFDRVPIGTTVDVYGNTNAFSPALGETAGTSAPAGDTAETTPDDGIQTEEPTPAPTVSTPPSNPTPTTTTAPAPQPAPAQPAPTQPVPTQPVPTQPVPTQPAPSEPAPSSEPATTAPPPAGGSSTSGQPAAPPPPDPAPAAG